jgi:methanogenic corrinoid protein MtbC1
MTINWCAYCQSFLGESAPFEAFEMTHGLCSSCARRGLDLSKVELSKVRRLQAIQMKLLEAGNAQTDVSSASALIDDACAAGVRPIDILMGFVTQSLRHVGAAWERGELTVAEGHRHTAFCEMILSLIEAKFPLSIAPQEASPANNSNRVEVLMINASENDHTLGVRFATLWLRSVGMTAQAIYPGIPEAELGGLLQRYQPKYLGISVSRADQEESVRKLVKRALQMNLLSPIKILLGGFAVRQDLIGEIEGAELVKDLPKYFSTLEKENSSS